MPPRSRKIPSLRLHRPTGQAVATFNGDDRYFGKAGTPEAQASYDRAVAEWLAASRGSAPKPGPRPEESGPSLNEVALAYVRHAEGYYVKDGKQTKEVWAIKTAVRTARELYGLAPAAEFGPLQLKAVRERFLDPGRDLSRGEVNKRTQHIVRMFRWAVAEGLVPSPVLEGLKAVPFLKKGRCAARESEPVRPAPEAWVEAVRPHVSRQVWAMIELQRLTGMRPGEVTGIRTCDICASGEVWTFTPGSHKAEHHGKSRTVYLGPRAQAILKAWLRPNLEEPLFQPREAERERREAGRAARKTRVQPSQSDRRKANPKRKPRDRYDAVSYRQAIVRACEGAKVPCWHPNQLRHNAGTRFRREFGLDVAQVLLGHSAASTTELYAELDRTKAAQAIAKVG